MLAWVKLESQRTAAGLGLQWPQWCRLHVQARVWVTGALFLLPSPPHPRICPGQEGIELGIEPRPAKGQASCPLSKHDCKLEKVYVKLRCLMRLRTFLESEFPECFWSLCIFQFSFTFVYIYLSQIQETSSCG